MRRALRAEWVKAMSDRGTVWLLAALVTLSVAVSVLSVAAARCPAAGCDQDPARISLTGVYLGQVVAALAGVLVIGGEYGTGMIRVTLAAVPRRGRLLAAKAIVVAGLVLAASALTVGASMLAGRLILPGHGFTSARGFSLAAAGWWRASLCGAADITLIALLGLGIAAAVRDSAAATGITLGVLYLFPVAAGLVRDPALQRHLEQIGPLAAGLDSQATAGLNSLPLSPWEGIGVVALWAAGALILGVVVLRQRDA
jgi:ABC-2 type transport system permease protein